jgi:hypothetical protein
LWASAKIVFAFLNSSRPCNLLAISALQVSRPNRPVLGRAKGIPMETTMKIRMSTLRVWSPATRILAAAATIFALLAIPNLGHAQGIVGGAQQGSSEGNRIAGPVGGVVGGAVGAGVGGAVGAVKGVFGIPDRGWRRGHRCRGYYGRSGRFHCYR